MRKFVCLLIALMMFSSLILPAMAEESRFVPSITYKDGPVIREIHGNVVFGSVEAESEGLAECVVVTSVAQAKNKSTDISQENRDLLLEVYEKLSDGSMKLALQGDYVIKELVDISFENNDCQVLEDHGHKDARLKEEGTKLVVTFELDIAANDNLVVMTYIDGKWEAIERVDNNGDGSVTCVFEDLCPVAFVLGDPEEAKAPAVDSDTSNSAAGDTLGLGFWMSIIAFCLAGIMMTVAAMKKKRR